MVESGRAFLIGDADRARADVIERILKLYFGAEAARVEEFEILKNSVAKSPWALVFIAHDLPYGNTRILPANLDSLVQQCNEQAKEIKICFLRPAPNSPSLRVSFDAHPLYISQTRPEAERLNEIIAEIEESSGLESVRVLPKIDWTREEQYLEAQARSAIEPMLRALDDESDLEIGGMTLRHIINTYFDCDQFAIDRIGQGKSGSVIFRVRPQKGAHEMGEFVLKLTDGRTLRQRENVRQELEGHRQAEKTLADGPYRGKHIPILQKPTRPRSGQEAGIVSCMHWDAVCYDFLGGKSFENIIELEKLLIASPKDLQREMENTPFQNMPPNQIAAHKTRVAIFTEFLQWLCNEWHKTPLRNEAKTPIWNFDEASHQKYGMKPPYSISRNTKEEILRFLRNRDAQLLGKRLFSGEWESLHQDVLHFIEGTLRPERLNRSLHAILTPAHGDLNANNVILWLSQKHPFLIDFPFFQEKGHAMQDLAQLETEIKFALMDRQEVGPIRNLKVYDYTHTQIEIWKELEDRLLGEDSWQEKKPKWQKGGFPGNIKLCFELIQKVRERAESVQEKKCGRTKIPAFFEEYLPALLYHTLRAISFDSLSIFKRLLAIYSTSRILGKLSSQ